MRFMSGDENDSMDMWISTYEYRRSDNQVSNSLSAILDRWPFYKQASGMKYIEYDYDQMFPAKKYNLMNKWASLKEKLTQLYKDNIKDKYYGELFRSLDPSLDESK
ncbi:PREDICTED: uncharacterized protein LOC108372629 [Rhagoletis zephyria]|uniref:uncharacterized protein LOC108372629 n=1 Tax=Rhagoletis zephyria TaxID=28612 RepID=UPI0008117FC3|nr:PREDICTED: uncharacterized protein LOC108372629 [Rhagoletis zephyria]